MPLSATLFLARPSGVAKILKAELALDAGILQANPAEFAEQRLLDRIETTFAELAD
jgi:hypothetical protein